MFERSADHFPTTFWTLIGNSARGTPEERRRALGELLRRYSRPIQAHVVRRWRFPPERAEDLAQGFITSKVLEQALFSRADNTRGKFRSFLCASLDRYVLEELRRSRRQKRDESRVVALDDAPEPVGRAPEVGNVFDVEWAREVLVEAARRMRERCEDSNRPDLWGVFEARVLGPTVRQEEPVSYRELVDRFGFQSPEQASNVLVTAKRMFVRALSAVVGEYVDGEAEIEAEIEDLRRILAGG